MTVGASGGFTGSVALTQTGLPNGTFTPGTIVTSGTSTLTVNTSALTAGHDVSVHDHGDERRGDALRLGVTRRAGGGGAGLRDQRVADVAHDRADEHDDVQRDDHPVQRVRRIGVARAQQGSSPA